MIELTPDELEQVKHALRTWGTDWYGPNPDYHPEREKAEAALKMLEAKESE